MFHLFQKYAVQIPFYLALITMALRAVSRLAAPHPRARALVEAVAAASPDVFRALGQLYRAATGSDLPLPSIDVRDAEIARQRDMIATQAARLREFESADVRAQDPLSRRATRVPPAALGALLMLMVSSLGCASIQKNAGAIETGVSIASAAEDALCGHSLDAWVGPVGPINPDAPLDTLPQVVAQVRSGVCNDDLRGLLERARELIRAAVRAAAASVAPRPAPTPAPPPTAPPEASVPPSDATGTVTP